MAMTLPAVDRPKVSVIIPNYNHANYLPQRIESVLSQTYANVDILILDDCSTDNSREIIANYARQDLRIRTEFNTENSGSTFKQWNKGIALTHNKYIWIAESDDYAAPDLLEKLVGKLEADATVGLAYCDSWHVHEDRQTVELDPDYFGTLDPVLWTNDFSLDGLTMVRKFMSYYNIIPNASAVVFRRTIAEQVGPADGNFKLVGDWLYWASILALSKVSFVAEPLNYFRSHSGNVRSSKQTNGTALLETVLIVKVMQRFGTPDTGFYTRKLREALDFWIHAIISPEYRIPISRHRAIFQAFKALDPAFNARFVTEFGKFMFSNKLSGVRMYLGDGVLYPFLKRIKAR